MKIRKTKIKTKINMLLSLVLCVTILVGNTITASAEAYHSGRFYFDISSVDSVEPGGDEVDFFNSEEKYYFYMFKALDYEWVPNKKYPSASNLREYAVNFYFSLNIGFQWKSSAERMTYFLAVTDKPLFADNDCDYAVPDMISLGLKNTSQNIRAFVYYSEDANNWTRIYNGHEYAGTTNGVSKNEMLASFMCFSSSRTLVMTTEPIRHYQTNEILYQKNMPDEWITNKTNIGQNLDGSGTGTGTGTEENDPYDDYDVSDNLNFFQFVKARMNSLVRSLGPAGTLILNLDKVVELLAKLPTDIYNELKDIPAFGYLEEIWNVTLGLPIAMAEEISQLPFVKEMLGYLKIAANIPATVVQSFLNSEFFQLFVGLPATMVQAFLDSDFGLIFFNLPLTIIESIINSDFGRWIFDIWDRTITLPVDIAEAIITGRFFETLRDYLGDLFLIPIKVAEELKKMFPIFYDPLSIFTGAVSANVKDWFTVLFGHVFTHLFVPEKDNLFSSLKIIMDECPLIASAFELKGVFSDFFATITGTASPEIHLALSTTFLGAYGVEDYSMTFEWFEPYRDSVLLIESAFLYLMFGFHSYFDIKNMFNASGSAMNVVPEVIYQVGRFR